MKPIKRKQKRIIAEYMFNQGVFAVRKEGRRRPEATGVTLREAIDNLEELEYRLRVARRTNFLGWCGVIGVTLMVVLTFGLM